MKRHKVYKRYLRQKYESGNIRSSTIRRSDHFATMTTEQWRISMSISRHDSSHVGAYFLRAGVCVTVLANRVFSQCFSSNELGGYHFLFQRFALFSTCIIIILDLSKSSDLDGTPNPLLGANNHRT